MSALVKSAKDFVNRCLAPLHCRLASTRVQPWEPTLAAGLNRLAARELGLGTLIDVGAADGAWARRCLAAVPSLHDVLLVEAQEVHRPALERFGREFPSVKIVFAAAGNEVGETWFEANDPFGGGAAHAPVGGGRWFRLPQTTLDTEVARHALPGPFLVKLDTHGYEVPILAGATRTLAGTAALIIECYNFDIAPTALRFPQFCLHMESLGFRCVDFWEPLYRESDHALWQFDLVFVRRERAEFAKGVAMMAETKP